MLKRGVMWVGVVAAIGAMFYGLTPKIAAQDSLYRTYAPLIEVNALVRREFVHPVRARGLVDGAIRGMLRELDPYSGYVAEHEMEAFRRRSTGHYIGIGVIAPMEHGPAIEAGVRAGDVIQAVEGRSCQDLSVFEVEALLAGEPGSTAQLTLRRGEEVLDLSIARAPVRRRALSGCAIDGAGRWSYIVDADANIGYVRVSRFSKGMIEDFDRVLADLANAGAKGLIVDLRFNPGGILHEAVATADRFLDEGVILRTLNRWGAVRTYTATATELLDGVDLAILVNGASASASEIVAGALQDHGRALLVGERTFGKGSVQDFIKIRNGRAGLRLTVAYYQLPNGRMVHKDRPAAAGEEWGVVPDLRIPLSEQEQAEILQSRMELGRSAGAGSHGSGGSPTSRRLLMDRQLQAAVDALRQRCAPREL